MLVQVAHGPAEAGSGQVAHSTGGAQQFKVQEGLGQVVHGMGGGIESGGSWYRD